MNPLWNLLHFRPRQIERRLDQLHAAGVLRERPTLWQLWLGTLYMYHRAVFRPETIGVDPDARVRDTGRARLWTRRSLRAPFVLGWAVNPLDHTGLGSSTRHVIRHLLGAYHPGDNLHYDLQIIAHDEGALTELRDELRAIVDGSHRWSEFFQDVVVYDGYHARALAIVEGWIERGNREPAGMAHDHADTTLTGFVAWCCRQPATPAATARELLWGDGLDFSPRLEAA